MAMLSRVGLEVIKFFQGNEFLVGARVFLIFSFVFFLFEIHEVFQSIDISGEFREEVGVLYYVDRGGVAGKIFVVAKNGGYRSYFASKTYVDLSGFDFDLYRGKEMHFRLDRGRIVSCFHSGKEVCRPKCNSVMECRLRAGYTGFGRFFSILFIGLAALAYVFYRIGFGRKLDV